MELSHELPRLATRGTRIVGPGGEPVRLRGVNRSGLEYTDAAGAGISPEDIREITAGWGANVIRLPFNQEWALGGVAGYLEAIDAVIGWAAELGAYTILDLQWIDVEARIAPVPDERSVELWAALAARYREEPAVLFDLYNEPHDVEPAEWTAWARRLTRAIRDVHPESLILVAGVDWATDISAVRLEEPNIVYSTHVYPHRKRRSWRRTVGRGAAEVPVFVGEWGGGDADLEWGRNFAAFLREYDLGWAAWSWADRPHLVVNARGGDYTPTVFGALVRAELSG